MAIASAPAKIILFGEHAVVYGIPALAAPVSALRAYAETIPNAEHGIRIDAPEIGASLPVGFDTETVDNALELTVRLVLREVGVTPPDIAVRLRSQIPIASGMGSGAAVSTALARSICAYLDVSLTDDMLNHMIFEVEKLHHGTPSGIDNTVVVYEKPVFFVRGQQPEVLRVGAPIKLLIGDTGHPSSTRDAVSGVRALYEAESQHVGGIFDTIREITLTVRHDIERGAIDRLGEQMTRNHALLRDLTVSSPQLDALVDAAMQAGALGAKLSGGGRGGIMIALVDDRGRSAVEQALRAAGAVNVTATEVT